MSNRAVSAVLGVLRRLQNTQGLGPGNAVLGFLQQWSGDQSESVILRLTLGIIEEVEDAQIAISNSSLSEEAKEGLNVTLAGLRAAFGVAGLNNALQSYVPALGPAITNFAIIASMIDAEMPGQVQSEIEALSHEIEELLKSVRDSDIDPTLRQAAVRHLGILLALLRNADAVGVEPALAAYFELLWQMRKLKEADSGKASEEPVNFWTRISSWGERLGKIADLVDAGSKLVPYIDKVPDLLKFLPK
jgi:hypothetical protein